MILVDSAVGSRELEPLIKVHGVECERSSLDSADACFEGHGPNGTIMVGLERKTLHDMLHCIDDARYNQQRARMKSMYDVSVLVLEGHWKPHNENGMLMEGFHNGINYGYAKPGGRRVMYNKLSRYLISVQLSGVILDRTRDIGHTAFDVVDWFHYFQKPWTGHTSLQELQKVAIPTLNGRPSLVRKWANDLDDIGTKMSELAERHFRTPIKLATAEETDWLKIPGVGVKTAQDIVRQVWGQRR